ncbi:MAG: hypothetical protein P8J17_12815 [Halioglobus sp.]|nr:hypothetical protein [Halioglobus sp.]
MALSRRVDALLAMVEADVVDVSWQLSQDVSRTAAYVEDAITGLGADVVAREDLPLAGTPEHRAEQAVERRQPKGAQRIQWA